MKCVKLAGWYSSLVGQFVRRSSLIQWNLMRLWDKTAYVQHSRMEMQT